MIKFTLTWVSEKNGQLCLERTFTQDMSWRIISIDSVFLTYRGNNECFCQCWILLETLVTKHGLLSNKVNVKYDQKVQPSASSNSCLEEAMRGGAACGQQTSLPSVLWMDYTPAPGAMMMFTDRCLNIILRPLFSWSMLMMPTCWDSIHLN